MIERLEKRRVKRFNPKVGDLVCDCRFNHQKIVKRNGDDVILEDGLSCSIFHCLDPADHKWIHPHIKPCS